MNLRTIIHRNESWYQEKTEPERIFEGVIKQHQVQSGPNTRTASAKYSLTTRESGRTTLISIYSPNVEEILSRFVEKEVILYGKIVDLSGEGFDQELWIGSIDKMND